MLVHLISNCDVAADRTGARLPADFVLLFPTKLFVKSEGLKREPI